MLHLAYITNTVILSIAERYRQPRINTQVYGYVTESRAQHYVALLPAFLNGLLKHSQKHGNDGNDLPSMEVHDLPAPATEQSQADPYQQYSYLDDVYEDTLQVSGSTDLYVIDEREDPEVIRTPSSCTDLFDALSKQEDLDVSAVQEVMSGMHNISTETLLGTEDVDHYTLLDKAVIYDSISMAEALLHNRQVDAKLLKDTVHLAAFVGSVEMMKLLLESCPTASSIRGKVRLESMAGQPSVLLQPYVGSVGSTDTHRQRLHWLSTHCRELPVYYAVCGDQVLVLKLLLASKEALDNSYSEPSDLDIERSSDVGFLSHLFSIACMCGSLKCADHLCDLLPQGPNTRDNQSILIVAKGLCHGLAFVRLLEDKGLDWKQLNQVDNRGSNALHFLYRGLSRQDKVYAKYRTVFEMTQYLVEHGVAVMQDTYAFKSHTIRDTPLHLLLEQTNYIIGTDVKDYIRANARSKMQRTYDRSLLQSINVILDAGYDTQLHINTLLQRLFENSNVWMRLLLADRLEDLSHHEYGLRNIYLVLSKLLKARVMVTYKRRDTTPYLYFFTGLYNSTSAFQILDKDSGDMFIAIIKMLLTCGISPNIYHLRNKDDWRQAPAMMFFLNALSYQYKLGAKVNDFILGKVVEVCDLFCSFDSTFVCSRMVAGRYVKCGVFDCVLEFLDPAIQGLETNDTADLEHVLQVMFQLIQLFILWGADGVLYTPHHQPYVTHGVCKTPVLSCWVSLSAQLESSHRITALPGYRQILTLLHNTADYKVYRRSLAGRIHTSLNESDAWTAYLREVAVNPRSLLSCCRASIYRTLRRGYKHRVTELPIPSFLIHYLLTLDHY